VSITHLRDIFIINLTINSNTCYYDEYDE